MIPRRSSRRRSLPPLLLSSQYSGYCMNRGGRSSFFPLFLALSRLVITKLAFNDGGEGWRRREEEQERKQWKTSDVCPRGIVIFIGSQLSRGFPPPTRRFLPPSPIIRAKSQRQWKYVALYSPRSVRRTFVCGRFGYSVRRETERGTGSRGMIVNLTALSRLFYWKLTYCEIISMRMQHIIIHLKRQEQVH